MCGVKFKIHLKRFNELKTNTNTNTLKQNLNTLQMKLTNTNNLAEDIKKEYIKLSQHEKINYSIKSEIDTARAYHYLNNLEFRTSATLIKMEQKREDTEAIENTLKRINFIKYQLEKQDTDIINLKREVETLTQKIEYFKTQFK